MSRPSPSRVAPGGHEPTPNARVPGGHEPPPGGVEAAIEADPPGSAGFTLVELLVSIIVTGILGAGVFGLLLKQNDFYREAGDTLDADVNRRGVGDVVASELRMVATSDLYKTKGDSIRARYDLRRAVVCDTLVGVSLFVYDEPDIRVPGGPTGTATSSPFQAEFEYEDGWTSNLIETGATPETVCGAFGAPTGLPVERYRLEGWTGHPTGKPAPGSVVRVYGDLVYTFKASSEAPGELALWRNDVELARPFAGGAGFSYIMANGNNENSVPNSNHKDIVRVRVQGSAIGDGANRYDVARDLEIEVPFLN